MNIRGNPRFTYSDGQAIIIDLNDGSTALMADLPNGQLVRLGSTPSLRFMDVQNAVAANNDRITRIIGTIVVSGYLSMPVLREIHGSLFLHDDARFHAPELCEVTGSIDSELPPDAPAFTGLIRIGGALMLKGHANAFPKLEVIGDSLVISDDYLDTGPALFPRLIDVGTRLSANIPIGLLDQRSGPIAVAPRFHILRAVYGNDLPGLVVHPPFEVPVASYPEQRRVWFDAAFARWKMYYDALDQIDQLSISPLSLDCAEIQENELGL